MGKKPRNRLQPKKNNHVPDEAVIAKEIAHGEDFKANKRKPTQDDH
jgi:hypothetical protein